MTAGTGQLAAPAGPGEVSSDLVDLQRTLYHSRNPTRRWLHRARLERISGELRRLAARPGMERAIEVGPGGGPYIELLCDLFAEVVATDVEESYLDHVRATHGQRDNLHMLLDDITRSRLDPESFDLVLCSEVIEHISDPHGVLRGIFRLLRPGGVLVLSTPQAYSTVELVGRLAFRPGVIELARLVYREPVLPTGHISLLTRRRLATLLSETGFLLDSTALTGVYLPGVAELGGRGALRLEQGLARRLSHGPLSWLLWTQHWTCERPS